MKYRGLFADDQGDSHFEEVEGTAGDGTVRALGPGGMLVMEDTEGNGHATRVTSPEDVLAVMVHLE